MIQVNRIYLIFNRLVTKKFLVDTSEQKKIVTLRSYVTMLTYDAYLDFNNNAVAMFAWYVCICNR